MAALRMAPDYDAIVQIDFVYTARCSHSVKHRSRLFVADQKGMAASGPEPNVVCAHKRPVLGQKPGQQRPGTSTRTITKWMGHHRRCAAAHDPGPAVCPGDHRKRSGPTLFRDNNN